jgi:hypothetical protein
MNNAFEQDAERFSEFLQVHYKDARTWKDPVGYCRWYMGHGFIAAVLDSDTGEITALASARPVERPGIGILPFYFNEGGKCLHIDILVDLSPDIRAILVFREICKLRFPQCRSVTMFRHFEEKLHVYEINKFWRYLEKLKKIHTKEREKL